MPNHVTNNLTFHGDPEAIQKMLEAVKNDEKGFGSIDFNKLLPMPPELNIESGSRTTDGINAYNAFVEIYTLGQDPEKMDLLNIPEDREKAFLNMRKDINKETWELGRAAFRNIQRFGHATWYSWCTCSWGTKWNAYDLNSDGNSLSFHTAWSPPLPVIRKLAECFPDNKSKRSLTVLKQPGMIGKHVQPALGEVMLKNLTNLMIQRFYNSLCEGDHPLAPKTIKNIHGILHKALDQAVKAGELKTNPADNCVLPRLVKPEITPMEPEEIRVNHFSCVI